MRNAAVSVLHETSQVTYISKSRENTVHHASPTGIDKNMITAIYIYRLEPIKGTIASTHMQVKLTLSGIMYTLRLY